MELEFLNSCMAVMRYSHQADSGHVDVFQEQDVVDLLYHNYYCYYLKTTLFKVVSFLFL